MHTPGKTLKELCRDSNRSGLAINHDWNTFYNNQQLAELSAQTSHKLLVED